MPIRSVTLRILGEGRSARAEMDWVNREADKLDKKKVNVEIGAKVKVNEFAAVRARVEELDRLSANIDVNVNDKKSMLAFAKFRAEVLSLDKVVAKPKISDLGLAKAQVRVAQLNQGFDSLLHSVNDFAVGLEKEDKRIGRLFTSGGGFGMLGRFAFGKIALFGGMATIGVLHLLVDVLFEVLAVVIPATIALGAFGVAGSDAAREVFNHMKNLHIVMDATDKVIKPMTGHMEALHEAVRPAVYQMFGDALTIMNEKTGIFEQLAKGTAGVLTHFAARMTVAITSTHGFGEFLRNAVPDLNKLMDIFGNVFGMIGNFLHIMPGVAQVLLNIADAASNAGEAFTRMGEPFMKVFLLLHGLWVWVGLAATGAFLLGRALTFLAATTIGKVVVAFGTIIAETITYTLTAGVATGATYLFQAALDSMAANPFVWIGAAIGAIAALVFWMHRSATQSTAWADTLQKSVDNAASVAMGLRLAQQALTISTSRLAVDQINLRKVQDTLTEGTQLNTARVRFNDLATRSQRDAIVQDTAAHQKFSDQVEFNIGRMSGLSKAYGGQKNAMALLNAAGITQAEWQDRSASGWAIITQKMNGTLRGYAAMSASTGMLNNDLAVMDRNITDQYKATQQLNGAWDTFISDVTGNQTNFDTFALGLQTLGKNFKSATAAAQTTTHTFQGLKEKTSLEGAAMDGLSQASLTVNQAFATTISNANTLFDSFRTAGISGQLLDRAIKDAIAPMLKYAVGSHEATAQLIALAQEGTFHGVPTLKNLTKWVGNTHGATKDLKHITNLMTEQEALLTGEMENQGNFIKNQLLNDIDQAVLKYFGVRDAAKAYGDAIAKSGKQSQDAQGKLDVLATKVYNAGRAMGDSKTKAEKMTAAMLGIPLQRVINIIEHGSGTFHIGQIFKKNPTQSGGNPFLTPNRGILVPGQGNTDSVPGLLTPGELVVPKPMVNAGLVDHLKGSIPGFAAGGLITKGNLGVLSGASSTNFDNRFLNTFTIAMERSMSTALLRAEKAAAGSGSAIANYARSFTHGGHPYVWGGTSPRGWDCSGFTGYVYHKFGYGAPRTSQQQQLWSTPSREQPGALVFFYGTGGNAAHVGISLGHGRMANASSPQTGTIVSGVGGNTGFGIPPGGFRGRGGMASALSGKGTNLELGRALASQMGWTGRQWMALRQLWQRESGWSDTITNPSSGAAGIAQRIQGWGPGYRRGNAQQQIIWGLNYIRNRPDERTPIGALAHENRFGWYAGGTKGAARGWAWVGERGPELVHMSGGETVLDNTTSRMVGGYAAGTEESLRGLSLIREFMHDRTQHALRKDMHHFLRVIAKYYDGANRHWRDEHVIRQTHAMEHTAKQLSHVKANLAAERSFQKSTFADLKGGFGALSSFDLTQGTPVTDDAGNTFGTPGVASQLKSKLSTMRSFITALKKLHRMGLPNSLFRQIVAMGPEAGLQFANEISGSPAFLHQFEKGEAALLGLEKQASQGAASSIYQDRWLTGRSFAKGLRNERHHLEVEFRHQGKVLGLEAARWFHVPKGKRPKGFASGGILREPVWGFGISGQEYTFGEMGDEMFAPMTQTRMGGSSRGGGTVININITASPLAHPSDIGREVVRAIKHYEKSGGAGWRNGRVAGTGALVKGVVQ